MGFIKTVLIGLAVLLATVILGNLVGLGPAEITVLLLVELVAALVYLLALKRRLSR